MPGDAGYGACKASGDTEGWSIYGSFDKTQQVCKFKYCNDSTAYGAAGNLLFSIIRAEPLSDSITCTYRENGEQKIKVIPGNLIPTTP
jgi:hypothetical protein